MTGACVNAQRRWASSLLYTSRGSLSGMMLSVMLGGALGALCRHLTALAVQPLLQGTTLAGFPLATLTVNVLGSLLLSLLFFANTSNLSPALQTAIGTGFLGSFTTFSAFELDTYKLAQEAQWAWVSLYVTGNLTLGFGAIVLGRALAQRLL